MQQQPVRFLLELCKLAKPDERAGHLALFEIHGDIQPARAPVHGYYHVAVAEHYALHTAFFLYIECGFFLVLISRGGYHRRICGVIEHACGHSAAQLTSARLPDSEQIDEHLHIEALHHVAQAEILARGLVVDNSEIPLAVYLGDIDPVNGAENPYPALGIGQLIGGQLAVGAYLHLEFNGAEVAL